MKQKRWILRMILAISLIPVIIVFSVLVFAPSNIWREERKVSVRDIYPFLKDGEMFSLADVYPFDWDEVVIGNVPGEAGDFYAELREFDSSFYIWDDIHFLFIFYRDGKVVEYFHYSLGRRDGTPIFGERHHVDLNWTKRISRENALFLCDGFQTNGKVYLCTLVPGT